MSKHEQTKKIYDMFHSKDIQPINKGYRDLVIPTEIAQIVYDEYYKQHQGQSFERIHERGGFGVVEIITYLYAHILDQREEIAGIKEQVQKTYEKMRSLSSGETITIPIPSCAECGKNSIHALEPVSDEASLDYCPLCLQCCEKGLMKKL